MHSLRRWRVWTKISRPRCLDSVTLAQNSALFGVFFGLTCKFARRLPIAGQERVRHTRCRASSCFVEKTGFPGQSTRMLRYYTGKLMGRPPQFGEGAPCCYYCGVLATTIDHVVPRHLLTRAGAAGIDLQQVMRIRLWTVPACHECNSTISGAIFRTMPERVAHIKSKLRKRYGKLLRTPKWTTEELDTLGPEMRRYVVAAMSQQEAVQARLRWKPAVYAEDFSAVYDLYRRIVQPDVSKMPTGDGE